ncbi:MAG TPA: SH3 domain-containing protein [Candidatus Limnocylindria bacterium]|nr:SH3 domain-containing protein [Candidatus Limnocylindria bacterium]
MSNQPYPPLRPQPPVRPRRRGPDPLPLVIGAILLAILVVLLLIVLLTGGDEDGGAASSPGASGSAAAASVDPGTSAPPATSSAAPTATPAPTSPPPVIAPPAGILPVGSAVVVTADQLRLRQAPATSAPVVTTANAGEEMFLVTNATALGPVQTGGFVWYLVLYQPGYQDWPMSPAGDPPLSGWVAAGTESESYLALAPTACPIGEVDISTLYALTPWARLACIGDRQITIEGTYGCADCSGDAAGTFTPEWLAHPIDLDLLRPPFAQPVSVVENMVLRIPPELPQVAPEQGGSILRVTGHFNDARSVDCVVAPGDPGQERVANDLAAEWYCREQFVVDAWEVIGTDPDFSPA